MATSEVSKYSVYDPRVVQTKPKYAVEKGALSLTNVSFNAQTANSTSQQFNVIVPSENVFIDRAVDWISGGVISIPVTLSTGTNAILDGAVLFNPGKDVALAAFPNHQGVSQMTATINDATVTVNTQDVLNQVLRLQDVAKNRKQRTCPTMLDLYAIEADAVTYPNSPLGAYGARYEADEEPNGAFTQWWFCNANGSITTGANVNAQGLPIAVAASSANQTVYIRWQSTEKLVLPPFIFGDSHELSTGLFGVQNFQVQMNVAPTPSRCVRIASSVINKTVQTGITISSVGVPQWSTSTALTYAPYPYQPSLSVQFLTPALDVPLPPKSIVPYMEFPRYITTGLPVIASTLTSLPNQKGVSPASTTIQSNTITLPNIPDLLVMYIKPATADATIFTSDTGVTGYGPAYTNGTVAGPYSWNSSLGDFTLPIEGISINFDNFSGLLANHTQYELYKMSVNNGLEMDFAEWRGISKAYTGGTTTSYVSTVGGPLVLRPGRDFALQAGQAPGLVGNFTLQVNLQVGNQFATTLATGMNLYIVPISSGFFETIKGSSRIIKGVLTEQDILSAAPHAPDEELERKVGAAKHKMGKTHMDALAAYRM